MVPHTQRRGPACVATSGAWLDRGQPVRHRRQLVVRPGAGIPHLFLAMGLRAHGRCARRRVPRRMARQPARPRPVHRAASRALLQPVQPPDRRGRGALHAWVVSAGVRRRRAMADGGEDRAHVPPAGAVLCRWRIGRTVDVLSPRDRRLLSARRPDLERDRRRTLARHLVGDRARPRLQPRVDAARRVHAGHRRRGRWQADPDGASTVLGLPPVSVDRRGGVRSSRPQGGFRPLLRGRPLAAG